MRRCFLLLLAGFFFPVYIYSQAGCTDTKANNYNPSAITNDGSCTYTATSLPLTNPKDLPATLFESSALVFTDGALWTLEDSGNGAEIFKVNESDGTVLQTVHVTNAVNQDWEELTADANYFYIGDFGNNASGDRTNLRIYRILKSDIGSGTSVNVTAEVINFTYPDQVVAPSPNNSTEFDCEAFLIKDNVLHLFTKNWITGHTQHYSVPSAPGSYTATKLDQFDSQGLITGASLGENNNIILIGYGTNLIDLFMWILYDYSGDNFFSGNKRKLNLGSSIDFFNRPNDKGQIEGVTFTSAGNGYISSERINRTIAATTFIVPARLYSFSIASLITLPVDLISFDASYINPDVKLIWQTASEINSAFYSIERSTDAIHFIEIGKQQAAGNSDRLNTYQYTDHKPASGNNYYRLVQTDIDGAKKIYTTKAVRIPAGNAKFRTYTVSGTSLIINSGTRGMLRNDFRVISGNGSMMLKGELFSSTQQVNIAALPKGQYVVQLGSGETVRFIK